MARTATAKAPKITGPSLKLQTFEKGNRKAAADAAGATATNRFRLVPRSAIKIVPGFNLRVTDTDEYRTGIQELKRSIMAHGWFNGEALGLLASKDDSGADVLYLVSGHRRFEAANLAAEEGKTGLDSLPASIDDSDVDPLELAVSLYKQNTGQQNTMLERSVLAHRMLTKGGMTAAQVAEKLDVTVRHVDDLKLLISAPKSVREAVKNNKVAATKAIEILRKVPEEAEAKIAALIQAKETKERESEIDDGGEKTPKVKMSTLKIDLEGAQGDQVSAAEWNPALSLIPETDWYKPGRKKGTIVLLEPVAVSIKIKRVKKDAATPDAAEAEAETETEVEPEPAPTPRKATGKKGRPPRELPDPDAPDEIEGDEVPDLRDLGIATPDNSDL